MDSRDRPRLRQALLARHPWVSDGEIGPAAVEAGECDRCGAEARIVMTCGPSTGRYLGRDCVAALGDEGWCEGHADEGSRLARRCLLLPPEADAVARLWWVATGEVRVDPALLLRDLRRLQLPSW